MKELDLDTVEIRGGPLVLATSADVEDLERELGTTLPPGYREYVTRLGWGTLNTFVRVLPPSEVRAQLEQHRGLMAGYWFWDDAPEGIDQDWAIESIPIADTLDGDVLTVHPGYARRIVILPRDVERAYARDDGLLEAIEWVCSGRVLRSFGPKRYFEPFDSEVVAGGPAPDASIDQSAMPPTLTAASAREHLENYFEALRDIEEWVVKTAGVGPKPLRGRNPPEWDVEIDLEGVRRADVTRAQYCTPRLADGLRGSGLSVTWPPPHDPSRYQIREETTTSKGHVTFRVAEGIEPDLPAMLVEYRLSRDGDGWRIASTRDLALEDEPKPRRSLLSRFIRRTD